MGAAFTRWLLTWMASTALVLAIFLGAWVVLLHGYHWLPEADAQRHAIVSYLLRGMGNELPEMAYLSPAEAFHLLDVRQLFARVDRLFVIVLACCLLLLYGWKRFASGCLALRSGYLGLACILLLGLLMALGGFVPLFVLLHYWLFPAGNWVFPDDSLLIRLFPLDYFFRFGLVYGVVVLGMFVGLIVWGHTRGRLS